MPRQYDLRPRQLTRLVSSPILDSTQVETMALATGPLSASAWRRGCSACTRRRCASTNGSGWFSRRARSAACASTPREEIERLRLIKHLVDEAGINLAGVQRLLSVAEVVERMRPLMTTSTLGRARRAPAPGARTRSAQPDPGTLTRWTSRTTTHARRRQDGHRQGDQAGRTASWRASTIPTSTRATRRPRRKFKEINEAYEVLGDADKRKKYDELGANWRMYEQAARAGGAGGDHGGWSVNMRRRPRRLPHDDAKTRCGRCSERTIRSPTSSTRSSAAPTRRGAGGRAGGRGRAAGKGRDLEHEIDAVARGRRSGRHAAAGDQARRPRAHGGRAHSRRCRRRLARAGERRRRIGAGGARGRRSVSADPAGAARPSSSGRDAISTRACRCR